MQFVISKISRHSNGLDEMFQRMRKIQEIATPLSRLAMTIKWDSSDTKVFYFFLAGSAPVRDSTEPFIVRPILKVYSRKGEKDAKALLSHITSSQCKSNSNIKMISSL